MKSLSLFCFIVLFTLITGCVEPRQFVALENRVAAIEMENNRNLSRLQEISAAKAQQDQLEKDLGAIQQRLQTGPVITQEAYAEMRYDISMLKEDFQKVQGQLDEMKHALSKVSAQGDTPFDTQLARLDQAVSNNYEKIIKLERYMGFEPTVAGQPVTLEQSSETQESAEQPAAVDEETVQYNQAKKLFDDGDHENARIQFENFINKYPDSDNADNARFWIADSYYVEKWYDKAILEYQKVLETYPDSNKMAASRLKQGYAFAELGETANARLILKVLLQKHPDSDEARFAREKLKQLK
jgi:tol-pal system protein YbgF